MRLVLARNDGLFAASWVLRTAGLAGDELDCFDNGANSTGSFPTFAF